MIPRTLTPVLAAALLWAPAASRAEGAAAPTPLADDATLVALAVSLACSDAPEQGGAPPPQAAPPAAEGPELELVATVRAKTLRFDVVPKVQVAFTGNGRRRTTWRTERVNLPMRPEAGVDYRDVQVRLTITTTIEELADLLRDAQRASGGIRLEPATAAAAPAATR
jgi:hypothetical protein